MHDAHGHPPTCRPRKAGNTLTVRPSPAGTLRRLRSRRRRDESVEVDLSPLIDCVFLLLIFFLVTTMLKKLEKQIPVTLPDYTSAIAAAAEPSAAIYALEADGAITHARDGQRTLNGLSYAPVESFEAELKRLATTRGTQTAIRLDTDRDVPVQKVIDILDTLALKGFANVGVRLRHRRDEDMELKGYR